ncbi:Metallo-beta-lactamase superfamily protein [Mycena kentingensis (nom. inval.)]|nr:Metallo-beta-lactamase superfamily protein [Mycena kentingensis (nom. inval.)]
MLAFIFTALAALLPVAMALKGVPDSKSTVRVLRFNVANLTAAGIVDGIYRPVVPGHESVTFPVYAFLVEHGTRKLLFDLGARERMWRTLRQRSLGSLRAGHSSSRARGISSTYSGTWGFRWRASKVLFGLTRTLTISCGDMSKFSGSTNLVVGGDTDISTFPTNPNSSLLESDFAGREVTKIDFGASELKFNDLRAFDYFGDGSLYLVDAPGVPRRWPPRRPRPRHSLPKPNLHPPRRRQLPPRRASPSAPRLPIRLPLPRAPPRLFHHPHLHRPLLLLPGSHDGHFDLPSRAAPLLSIADAGSVLRFSADPVQGAVTLEKIARWDADEDVLVLIVHDASVVSGDVLPYYPRALNGWKKAGWKQKSVWRFLDVDGPAWVFGPRVDLGHRPEEFSEHMD